MTNKIEIKTPDYHTKLLPCPFCGNDEIHITKSRLWHEFLDGSCHGYKDCYEFDVVCNKCGAHPTYHKNDTIYRSEEEAISHVVNAWNKRTMNSVDEAKDVFKKRVMNSIYGRFNSVNEVKEEVQYDGESIDPCIKIIDDTDWLLTKILDVEQRGKLHSIALEATKLLRKFEGREVEK